MGVEEKTPLLMPLLNDTARDSVVPASPSRWHKIQQTVVPIILDIVPNIMLGFLVQHSRNDPGERILTALTFAGIVQSQIVQTLQLVLRNSLNARREELKDPRKRKELWVMAQAAWIVYMAYLPLAILVIGFSAWLCRDTLFGQNDDIADIVASLLVINMVSLPFSLGSSMLHSVLAEQQALRPFVVAAIISWTIGLSFAYILGFWTPLGFVGIALTDVITYAIQFGMLVPKTQHVTEWPGWHFRQAFALVPRLGCHPAMIGTLLVNLVVMLFGFMSLLASLVDVDTWIPDAQHKVFPSLFMLSFAPLLGVCLFLSMKIKSGLAAAFGGDTKLAAQPVRFAIGILLFTAFASTSWIVGGLHQGDHALPSGLVNVFTSALKAFVPAFPPVGFVMAIRPILRTCVSLLYPASAVFVVAMIVGTVVGAVFADYLHGGIQGLWYGQFMGIVAFTVTAAVSMGRWTQAIHNDERV